MLAPISVAQSRRVVAATGLRLRRKHEATWAEQMLRPFMFSTERKWKHQARRVPWTQIQHLLGLWWDDVTTGSVRRPLNRQQVRQFGGTVFDIQPAVSSGQAVGALLRLEPLLGFKLRPDVLRREGYDSKEEFVNDLCSRLKAEFRRLQAAHTPSVRVCKGREHQ
jgi:hypothetical protein